MADHSTDLSGVITHPSTSCESGFPFQHEVCLHACLMLRKAWWERECSEFAVGYEVSEIPKFDDVVCKFKFHRKDHDIYFQAKHTERITKKISKDLLFSTSSSKSSRDWDLKQYFKSMINLKDNKNTNQKFILITNTHLKEIEMVDFPIDDSEINKLLKNLRENEAKIQRFSRSLEKDFKNLLQEEIRSQDNLNYIFENLIIVTNCPDLKKLTEINNELTNKMVDKENTTYFPDIVRKKISQHIEFDRKSKTRRFITETDFETIRANSLVDFDLQCPTVVIEPDMKTQQKNALKYYEQKAKKHWTRLKTKGRF
ncbi:hypothetical protein DMENIID0001_156800 [Sergentomyia squamirostris]